MDTDIQRLSRVPALTAAGFLVSAVCKLRITLGGAAKVWEQPYASKACTPVISGGHVYWAWGRLRCLDLATGRQEWEGGSYGDAGSCIVTADRKVIVWGDRGKLALVETAEASPGKSSEVSRTVRLFSEVVWPHVVLANGRLYCKDREGNLKCFRVAGPAP